DHDGLRRRLSDLSRQALRGLGAGGPGWPACREGARDPRRDQAAGRRTALGAGAALMAPSLPRRAAAEGFAAFALVFAGCGAIVSDTVNDGVLGAVGVSLVFGLVIMAMDYATGHWA